MTDDLGPLPEVHPRDEIIARAKSHMRRTVIDVGSQHGLTLAETFVCLSHVLSFYAEAAFLREQLKDSTK